MDDHREIGRWPGMLESIIEQANVWLDMHDNQGRVTLWNKAAEEISGYDESESWTESPWGGATAFIQKPYQFKDLRQAIADLLGAGAEKA